MITFIVILVAVWGLCEIVGGALMVLYGAILWIASIVGRIVR